MINFYKLKEILYLWLAQYFAYFAAYRGIAGGQPEDQDIDGSPAKTVSPEELFREKILAKEYDEAIEIARRNGLNTDLVYQIQWKEAVVSSSSIALYLKRVSDPAWILNECVTRIADTIDGQRLLLNYGLELTRNDQYITVEETNDAVGDIPSKTIKKRIDVNNVELSELSADKQHRIVARCRLLHYIDRLNIVENIIGTMVPSQYDKAFFEQFREDTVLSCAITFAHASNYKAIAELFTYSGSEVLQHWLPILSQFPECRSPFDYRAVMPECNTDGEVVAWPEETPREKDWSEDFCANHCPLYNPYEYEERFYKENPQLEKFRGRNLTRERLSEWFVTRSKEIERRTGMVYNALDLLKLGMEQHISNLSDLHDHMDTFAKIVYECFPRTSRQNNLTYDEFTVLTDNQVITLLMLGANESERTFLRCIKHYLMPFLERRDRLKDENRATEMLLEYLIGIGKNDLSLVRAVFEDCVREDQEKQYEDEPIFTDVRILLQLALDVIYASVQEDQLEEAFKIVECLPQRVEDCPANIALLQDKIDDLEKHLAVSELLETYEIYISLSKLRTLQEQSSVKEVKELFNRITRMAPKQVDKAGGKPKPFGERDWLKLLNDLQIIHKDCFASSFPIELVNEMLLNSILTINLRGNLPLIGRLLSSLPSPTRIQVVLDATKCYLDAAGSMSDESIMLAKECLELLSKEELASNPKAQEELDFIEAMGLLDKEFDLSLLPVQIRLMDLPRLNLLTTIIESTRGSHKKFEQVLRVARLLRIGSDRGDRQRDALVLLALGDAALQSKDKAGCWKICTYIIKEQLTEASILCYKLAKENIASTSQRDKLLNFAVTYCDGPLISEVLDLIMRSNSLNEQIHNNVHTQVS